MVRVASCPERKFFSCVEKRRTHIVCLLAKIGQALETKILKSRAFWGIWNASGDSGNSLAMIGAEYIGKFEHCWDTLRKEPESKVQAEWK